MRLGADVGAWPGRGARVRATLRDGTVQKGRYHGNFLSLHTRGRTVIVIERAGQLHMIYREHVQAMEVLD
jgi:hypothetical protein